MEYNVVLGWKGNHQRTSSSFYNFHCIVRTLLFFIIKPNYVIETVNLKPILNFSLCKISYIKWFENLSYNDNDTLGFANSWAEWSFLMKVWNKCYLNSDRILFSLFYILSTLLSIAIMIMVVMYYPWSGFCRWTLKATCPFQLSIEYPFSELNMFGNIVFKYFWKVSSYR